MADATLTEERPRHTGGGTSTREDRLLTIDTPLGKLSTLHLVKQRDAGDNAVDVWLAAERNLIPVKLLIVENDGSKFEQIITQLEFK